jgi:hypothetical protein
MSQSDSSFVKILRSSFAGLVGGAVGGFIYASLLWSFHLQSALIAAFIGGISVSIANPVSIVGNTWWQKGLLWGTTMAITISVLVHLLLPSTDLDVVSVVSAFIPSGLVYYFLNERLLPGSRSS